MIDKAKLLKRRKHLDTQRKGKYVLQIVIGVDPATGNIQISVPNGMPLPTVLGFIEVAKVLLSKPLLGEQPSIVPAPAGILDRLKNSNGQ